MKVEPPQHLDWDIACAHCGQWLGDEDEGRRRGCGARNRSAARGHLVEHMMKIEYDSEAEAAYTTLREGVPFAFTHNVDDARNIDYGPDDKPIGVELLSVSQGVDLTDLPQRSRLARLLAEAQLPGWDED